MNKNFSMARILIPYGCTFLTVNAASIAVKFIDDGQDTPWGTAIAGAPGFAQANWNFLITDWSGNPENDAALGNIVTSEGIAASELQAISYDGTSDPIHFDAANTWSSGAGNATANDTLMNGYLDDGNDDQPFINLSLSDLVESSTVVVYFHGDAPAGSVGRYWIEEWTDPLVAGTPITDLVGIAANDWDGTFVSAGSFSQTGTPSNVDIDTNSNYIVFENITARNIRIRGAGNGDPEDFGRGPINGFQVITVPVPETSSALTVLLGSLVLLRRRR